MAAVSTPVQLELAPEGLSVLLHGQRKIVPTSLIESSVLLKTLVADSDHEEKASIPIGVDGLEAWLQFNSAGKAAFDARELLTVVKVRY